MADEDTELVMQELVAIRRDLATLLTGMEAAAVRQETIIAALEALRADLARTVEASDRGRRELPLPAPAARQGTYSRRREGASPEWTSSGDSSAGGRSGQPRPLRIGRPDPAGRFRGHGAVATVATTVVERLAFVIS